jgi:hypothetical protein
MAYKLITPPPMATTAEAMPEVRAGGCEPTGPGSSPGQNRGVFGGFLPTRAPPARLRLRRTLVRLGGGTTSPLELLGVA